MAKHLLNMLVIGHNNIDVNVNILSYLHEHLVDIIEQEVLEVLNKYNISKGETMSSKDDTGKPQIAVRIPGNELVALKMTVDDFKMKWLVYGVLTVVVPAWAGGTYGPII